MNRVQRGQVEMFDRVGEFRERYRNRVADGSPAAAAFDRLDAVVTRLRDADAAALARRRAGRDLKPSVRINLQRQLEAIARTARVIGRRVPGFAEPFALPRSRRDGVLQSAAVAFLRDVPPLAARFTERGLPATFVEDLQAAYAAFEQALATLAAARVMRASGRAAVREAIRLGREAVEEVDVIVRYQFGDDAEMQAAWTSARRLDRLARESKGAVSQPAEPAQPSRPAQPPQPAPSSQPVVVSKVMTPAA